MHRQIQEQRLREASVEGICCIHVSMGWWLSLVYRYNAAQSHLCATPGLFILTSIFTHGIFIVVFLRIFIGRRGKFAFAHERLVQ